MEAGNHSAWPDDVDISLTNCLTTVKALVQEESIFDEHVSGVQCWSPELCEHVWESTAKLLPMVTIAACVVVLCSVPGSSMQAFTDSWCVHSRIYYETQLSIVSQLLAFTFFQSLKAVDGPAQLVYWTCSLVTLASPHQVRCLFSWIWNEIKFIAKILMKISITA
jgi:hypothetical protein